MGLFCDRYTDVTCYICVILVSRIVNDVFTTRLRLFVLEVYRVRQWFFYYCN